MPAAIERRFDAAFINRVANDPSVDRWVRGYLTGEIDFSEAVADQRNILLVGEHGGMLFHAHQPGLFECHTLVLPSGRGRWTLGLVEACLHWVFTRTDAIEVMTRVPKGNVRARALVQAIHGVYEFTNKTGWVMDLDTVPADIFSMHVQAWIRDAPGLPERGAWFHAKLEKELARFGKGFQRWDASGDRHIGAAIEMILGGQPHKGVIFFNRFAALGGYAPASVISTDPVSIDIQTGILIASADDFWLASCNV